MSEALLAECSIAAEPASRTEKVLLPVLSSRYWLPLLLLALTALCYANMLRNPFLYDDVPLVAQNPEIVSGSSRTR